MNASTSGQRIHAMNETRALNRAREVLRLVRRLGRGRPVLSSGLRLAMGLHVAVRLGFAVASVIAMPSAVIFRAEEFGFIRRLLVTGSEENDDGGEENR